jgi:hypothetical protein
MKPGCPSPGTITAFGMGMAPSCTSVGSLLGSFLSAYPAPANNVIQSFGPNGVPNYIDLPTIITPIVTTIVTPLIRPTYWTPVTGLPANIEYNAGSVNIGAIANISTANIGQINANNLTLNNLTLSANLNGNPI